MYFNVTRLDNFILSSAVLELVRMKIQGYFKLVV